MMSKKNVLKKSDIYAILDKQIYHKKNIARFINSLLRNNIQIIQLRDKKSPLKKLLKKAILIKKIIKNRSLFIINDYPEICLLSGADGLHIGQDDLSLKLARKILGDDKIIGVSCHNIRQTEIAQSQGADYIGFGPIFKTPTKKEGLPIGIKYIRYLKKKMRIPFFIIGGIDLAQLKDLMPFKINHIAVSSALCQTNNMTMRIRQLRDYLY